MALAEDDYVIQALPPDAADHLLRTRIRPGAPRGGEDLVHAQTRNTPLKPLAVHGIAVSEQVRGCRSRYRASCFRRKSFSAARAVRDRRPTPRNRTRSIPSAAPTRQKGMNGSTVPMPNRTPPLPAGIHGKVRISDARRETLLARNERRMEFLRTTGLGSRDRLEGMGIGMTCQD
jgi:hypothetical protein